MSDFNVGTLKHIALHQDLHHLEHHLWKVVKSYGKTGLQEKLEMKGFDNLWKPL